jgi:hypothetical protein
MKKKGTNSRRAAAQHRVISSFDHRKRREADELRSMIQKMGPYDDTLYDKLTQAKEQGILDVLHRVLDDDEEQQQRRNSTIVQFYRKPLHIIILEAFRVVREVVSDLSDVSSVADLQRVLTADGRAKHIGVILVATSLLILLLLSAHD